MRRAIIEGAHSLRECVARMAEDSKASVAHLTAEVTAYRARLEEAERASNTDPLTRLDNRYAFEKHLEERIELKKPFCLIMIDLNGFKMVNDRLGHIAGDDLLKQFADGLKSQFGPDEIICRWGGDEFVLIVDGKLGDGQAKINRLRHCFREYKINGAHEDTKVPLSAAVGIAQWDGRESGLNC